MSIRFGPSSWYYPGWIGSVYKKSYKTKNGPVIPDIGPEQKVDDRQCLAELCEFPLFQSACADYTYYSSPAKMRSTLVKDSKFLGHNFTLAFKATKGIVTYQAQNGTNQSSGDDFLSSEYFLTRFYTPITEIFRPEDIEAFILEFPPAPSYVLSSDEFNRKLDDFLAGVKACRYPIACEIRSPHLLNSEYAAVLNAHGAGHTFNHWVKMPRPHEQLSILGGIPGKYLSFRVMTPLQMQFTETKMEFYPYESIKRPDDAMIKSVSDVIIEGFDQKLPIIVYVNNRAEGNSPATMERILAQLRETRPKVLDNIVNRNIKKNEPRQVELF